MGQLRTIAWRKPLVLICVTLSLYIPLFYIDLVVVDLFIVSKDVRQVSNDELRTPALRKASDSSHPLCFRLNRFQALLLPRKRQVLTPIKSYDTTRQLP
jgi:hypothetical protein